MTTRVDLSYTGTAHSHTEDFPYSESQLGYAFQFLCDNPTLVSDMFETDDKKHPQSTHI